jgi:hypothetical protein
MVRFFEIHENMKRPREAVPNLYPRHKSAMFCFLADDDDQQHFNLLAVDALGTTTLIAPFYVAIRLIVREKNALFTVI